MFLFLRLKVKLKLGKQFRATWKKTDRNAVWVVGSGGPKKSCVRWGPDPPWEGAILGKRGAHCKVSCAKTAEPIDLPFGLWTQVGRSKHKFNSICQVVPMNRASAAAMRPMLNCFDYLLLWPPYGIGQAIIFLPCGFFLSFFLSSFHRLISAAADWMSTILPHMVWP